MLFVLIVGDEKKITRELDSGLGNYYPGMGREYQLSIKEQFITSDCRAVFLWEQSEEEIKSHLDTLARLNFQRPIIVFGSSKNSTIAENLASGRIKLFVYHHEISRQDDNTFLRIVDLLKNGDSAKEFVVEEEYRKIDSSSFSSIGAMLVTDIQGRATYANESFLMLIGQGNEEEIIGKKVLEELGSIGDAGLLLGELQLGGGWHGELVLNTIDGKTVFTNLYASLAYDKKGKPNRVIYSFRDVTPQRRAEEKLRRINSALQIIRKCSAAIASTNSEKSLIDNVCKIIITNTRYPLAWVSYIVDGSEGEIVPVAIASGDGMPGQNMPDICHSEKFFKCRISQCIKTHEPVIINELPECCPEESSIGQLINVGIVSIICFPLKNKGKIFGILTIAALDHIETGEEEVISLTEMADDLAFAIAALRVEIRHENLEMALLRQKGLSRERFRIINELNKVLEAYDYSVTNALKVPLRYIEGYSQLLSEKYLEKLDEEGRKYLQVIHSSVKNANRIADNLSMLSRAAHQEIEIEEVDLSIIAQSVAANLMGLNSSREIDIDISEGLVCSASMYLATVLIEILFENAWKSTEFAEKSKIEFGRLVVGSETVYYVKDNGCGFEPKRAERIFTPFHSYHTDASFEGTGLGLATAERIVKRHGGRIWAEGELDAGATIYFSLKKKK